MMKTAAAMITVFLLLIIFQSQIKASIYEYRMNSAVESLKLDEEDEEELKAEISRIAEGYRRQSFTDVERQTLLNIRQEISGEGPLSSRDIDLITDRLRILAERHNL